MKHLMYDPYIYTQTCVKRLVEQHARTPRLILAVDWDDTLYDFHHKGYEYERAIAAVKRAQAAGFLIVCFTASANERHPMIRAHAETLGIRFDGINENVIDSPFGRDGAKIFYNLLLDDRAGLGQALTVLEWTLDRIGG